MECKSCLGRILEGRRQRDTIPHTLNHFFQSRLANSHLKINPSTCFGYGHDLTHPMEVQQILATTSTQHSEIFSSRSFGRIRHQNLWIFAKSLLSGLIFSPFFNESNTKTISKALQVTQSITNDSKPDFRSHHDLFVSFFGVNFWSELVATWLQQSIGPWWAYIKKFIWASQDWHS